jgi:membrane protease YdiL (CAAX protease family)
VFTQLSPGRKAALFYALALSLCAGLSLLMHSTGERAAVAAMFTPLTAVLIMQFVITRDGYHRAGWTGLGLSRAGLRYWPVALLLPVVLLAGSESVVGLTGRTTADWSKLPSPADLVIGLVVLMAFCFFEEIGWRGYLLPNVTAWAGQRGRAVPSLVVGFLHGLWHLPIVFLVSGAYLTEGNRWVTVPIFLALLTAAGALYGWLRDSSGSVWPAVITHAAFNLGLGVIADTWTTTDPGTVALVGRETGIATLGLVVIAAVVVHSRRSPAPLVRPAEVPVPVG